MSFVAVASLRWNRGREESQRVRRRYVGRRYVACLAITTALLAPTKPALPAVPEPIGWLTGAAFQERLSRPADDIYWSSLPLRQAIERFSRAEKTAILLDRRIDPDQRVDLTMSKLSLREAFHRIAEHLEAGVSLPAGVVYLGPSPVAARLWTLAELRREEGRRLPGGVGRKFLQAARLSWPDFSAPRDLLDGLAAQNGITISGLEQIPHDLWAAADLPALPLVDRLTLIAVQFDLTFQIAADGRSVRLVPVPDDVAIVRAHPVGKQPQEQVARWAELAPDARIKIAGDRVFVKGTMEDHQRIADAQRPVRRPSSRPARTKGEGEKRYTVAAAKGPLGKLLQELCARFELELHVDEEALRQAGISLQQQVSFSAKDATVDGLFEALLKPAGCTFQRRGKAIEVRPAK